MFVSDIISLWGCGEKRTAGSGFLLKSRAADAVALLTVAPMKWSKSLYPAPETIVYRGGKREKKQKTPEKRLSGLCLWVERRWIVPVCVVTTFQKVTGRLGALKEVRLADRTPADDVLQYYYLPLVIASKLTQHGLSSVSSRLFLSSCPPSEFCPESCSCNWDIYCTNRPSAFWLRALKKEKNNSLYQKKLDSHANTMKNLTTAARVGPSGSTFQLLPLKTYTFWFKRKNNQLLDALSKH